MAIDKIDRKELITRFIDAFSDSISFYVVTEDNPCRIFFNGIEMYVYIKNLSPAQLSNDNPDIWRIQLPIRDTFAEIKKSSLPFILLGYDAQNDIFTTWNPYWAKQRLNIAKSVSFYSRYSVQAKARETQGFQRKSLNNDGEVIAFPRTSIATFLVSINAFFSDETNYVAMGSRKRTEANEAYKIFSTYQPQMHNFARYLAEMKLAEGTVKNYCWAVQHLMNKGYVSRNRKVFLACDSLLEYPGVVQKFFNIPEVKKQNELLNNALSAALSNYIQYLVDTPQNTSKVDIEDKIEHNIDDSENIPDENKMLFERFCDSENIQKFKTYLETQQLSVRSSYLYMQAVDELFENGYIERYADVFLEYRTIEQYYRRASKKFFLVPEVKKLNDKNKCVYSAALNHYIKSLLDYYSEQPVKEQSEVKEEQVILENIDHKDWVTPYINECGKLTRLADPEVIEELRPLLDAEYPSIAAAFNVIEKHYQTRFPTMTLGEWNTIMNNINWQKPYDNETDETETVEYEGKQKTHILKVTTPEGEIFNDKKVSDTLVKVIKYAGAEAVREMNIIICGTNMIVTEDDINSRYEVATKYVGDGLYANTTSSTSKKYHLIKQISETLDLGLEVEYLPVDGGNSEPVTYPTGDVARQKIRVMFPDGRIIQHTMVLSTLIEVIKYAKPELVRDLNIINCANNLILKSHEINPRYKKATKQLDDTYYVNTCSATYTKYMQIKEISDKLKLDLIVDLV